jgi:hypothetical protein
MIQLKNENFQDLSNYIPKEFKESERYCLQTLYNQKDSEAMVTTIDHLAQEVFSRITSTNISNPSFLPLPQDGETELTKPRIAWINKYGPCQRTGFHKHDDPIFTQNATHYAIYILAVGSQTETISFIDKDGIQQDIPVVPGDLFIGHCSEEHGALPVKEYLCAMMFKINVP